MFVLIVCKGDHMVALAVLYNRALFPNSSSDYYSAYGNGREVLGKTVYY